MRRFVTLLLYALLCGQALGSAEEPVTEGLDSGSAVRPQVYPAERIATLFPAAAQVGVAVAVVPDPLVPRYRRPYDLDIVALELGMLRDGYVLDRFYLPWNDELRQQRAGPSGSGSAQSRLRQVPMRYRYGLMLFRCDSWRAREQLHASSSSGSANGDSTCNAPLTESATRGARIRALYLVTDTATKGIESASMLCAIDRINSQLIPRAADGAAPRQRAQGCWDWPDATRPASSADLPAPPTALLSYPDACHSNQHAGTLLVLGPNFSGALDSAGEIGKQLQLTLGNDLASQPVKGMCLLSSSATDNTNHEVSDVWNNAAFSVRYDSLALDNYQKLREIAHLLPALVGEPRGREPQQRHSPPVAILAESSTYGYGVCGYADQPHHPMTSEVRNLCLSALRLYFPANIADIRYGMQQDQQRTVASNPLKLTVPDGHLSLDLGAENGSEYPESRQSGLTSVGTQLALEQMFAQLQAQPPQMVIVIATDVRDRLFLFDELRKRLARAMLVDLESDNLIGHPDFLHASRGALAIGSADLNAQGPTYACDSAPQVTSQMMSSWSTDYQAILAHAVSRLYDPATERSTKTCETRSFRLRPPQMQLISLEGLKDITRKTPATALQGRPPVDDRVLLAGAELSAPFFCLAAAWLLIGPLALSNLRPPSTNTPASSRVNLILGGFCVLYPVVAYLMSRSLHRRDHDNLVCLVTIILMFVALGGLAVCVRRLRQATCTVPLAQLRTLAGPAVLALSAACFATLPSIWYASIRSSAPPDLDVSALEAIALDPNPGLAFLLLIATATLVLLYCCVVLSTGVGIVNRNSAVLRGVGEAPRTRPVAAVPGDAEPPPIMAIPVGIGVGAVREAPLAGSVDELQMARATLSRPILPAWRALRSVTGAARELPSNRRQRSKREMRGVLNLNPFGVLAGGTLVIALIVVPDLLWGDIRLTVFGPLASRIALLAITATSLCSLLLLACSLGMARRISGVSRYLATARRNSSAEGSIGRWPADLHGPRIFPPTPVVARACDGGSVAEWLLWEATQEQWRERVSGWLLLDKSDSEHLAAIFALLASELSVFRWSALGSVLCALASVTTVYLFPIEADSLLMFNLLLLLGVGAIAGLAATTFERDTLMSNVLCNRPAPRKFSTPLFVFIAVPFVALAVAVAITELPGVIDWSGGVLQLLVALGLHP